MKVFLIVAVFFSFIISARVVMACSCGGSTSVCGAYADAEAVFVGSVERVENRMAKSEDGREYTLGQTAYVQVLESFKGVKETELVFRSYGSSCDAFYKEGQRWLFYVSYNQKDKAWVVGACGRSTALESVPDDLLYLRGLPASAQKTRLAGKLVSPANQPMMGIKVKLITGREVYEVFTDKNGVYEAYGLAPGKYSVKPEIPASLKVKFSIASEGVDYSDRATIAITLKEKSCAGVNFYYSENTIITGRVVGADGRPLRDVCVRLLLKDNPSKTGFLLDCTDDGGRFKIDEIPLGQYLLVANDDGRISSTEPFPITYYPGVFDKEKATVLLFASGNKLQDFDIHIPSQQSTRTVQGVLLFSDGRPVAGEFVQFKAEAKREGQEGDANAKTDAEGRFSLRVLSGVKGSLSGEMYTHTGEFENCRALDKLLKANGGSMTVNTNRIELEANREFSDVELVFPFPYCAKAKDPN